MGRRKSANPGAVGVLKSQPGEIEPETPFENVLEANIAKDMRRLTALGYPCSEYGDLVAILKRVPRETTAFYTARAIFWACRAIFETDPNSRLNLAYQAGWERAAAKAARVLGTDIARGKTVVQGAKKGGASRRLPQTEIDVTDMRQVMEKQKLSQRGAAEYLAKMRNPKARKDKMKAAAEAIRNRTKSYLKNSG